MSNVEKIAQISLLNARNCLEARNHGRAFANFLLFLKLKSENAADVYTEFALATREWCEQLEGQNRLEDLFKCYDQACEMFPDHDVVLNNIGAQLFRLGYIEEAAAYIRKSLLVNPNYLAARDNLENVCSHLVERWHFSMLNDTRRNNAFKYAIDKAIKSGYNTVLDIGTGTGILSMMSECSGALEVTACDGSRAMVDVARDVLLANDVHKIHLLHKHSSDIQVPRDLSSRVKLVVTETFDAGLFGEHIVSTLIHAWKNLISTSPMGTVIPCGATMYVCGIECETIRTQSRLLYPVLQHLDVSHVELLCNTGHIAEEPYTTENLAKIRGGYKILTNIAEFLRELESLYKGRDWLCDLYVKQSGRVDALAVWFDLHLDDTITIATGADNKSCWEQAIYPITSVKRQHASSHESCHVKRREKLRTTFHFERDCLRLSKCEVKNEQLKVRNVKNTAMVKGAAGESLLTSAGKSVYSVPRSSGTSVKECRANCLPFRKRKVESSESNIYTCTCDADASVSGSKFESEQKPGSVTDDVCASSEPTCVRISQKSKTETVLGVRKIATDTEKNHIMSHSGEYMIRSNGISDTEADQLTRDDSEVQCEFHDTNTDFELDECVKKPQEIDKTVSENRLPGLEPDISGEEGYKFVSTSCNNESDKINSATGLDLDMHIEMEKCSIDKNVTYEHKTADNADGNNTSLHERHHNLSNFTWSPSQNLTNPASGNFDAMPSLDSNDHGLVAMAGIHSQTIPKLTCYAEQADLEYINDIQLNRRYCQVLEIFKSQRPDKYTSLLYITPRLSFLGIQAAKMGYDLVTMAVPEEHHSTIHQVAALNGCKPGEVILMELSDLNELDLKVDVIVCDVVEPCGALRQQVLEDLVYHSFASLNSGGLILPAEVKVQGLFIESEELESLSHVTGNDRTLGFQIADFINVFQMQNHMNIDMTTLSYTKLTDVQELLHLDLGGITMETSAPCIDQTVEKSLEVVTSGKVTALVYWFEIRLNKDIVVSTLDSRCHWKQAGIVLKDDISIETGQHIVSKIKLQNSCLDVKIVQLKSQSGHSRKFNSTDNK